MASRPNPSWSEPQKKVFNQIQEATAIAIPYFGEDIPALDNHTPVMVCDELGVIKAVRKMFDQVEETLKERFKPMMGKELEFRGSKYVAEKRPSTRTALNQGKVKTFLQQADDEGIDLQKLLDAVIEKKVTVPNDVFFETDEEGELKETNTNLFNSSTPVSSLFVEPIA